MFEAATVNVQTEAGFSPLTVWFVFIPCILMSVLSTLLIVLVMIAGMTSTMVPMAIQAPVLILLASIFILPAVLVTGIWRRWGIGTLRRKWLVGAALLFGVLWLAIGSERLVNDNGDWFLHLPVWICGLPLVISAVLAIRTFKAEPSEIVVQSRT